MDVRAFGSRTSAEKSFIFLRSERWGESLWAGTSARISARTSAGYLARKLYVEAAFPFLIQDCLEQFCYAEVPP